jgi:CheY-like chemotaxis protein
MESVARLAGGLAHTFNNLLTVIQGHTEFAQKAAAKDAEVASDLTHVLEAAGRIKELVQQLLAFSRRQVLKPRNIELKEVLRDFDELIRRLIPEHIELVTLFGSGIWSVKADPAQLEQVLLMLSVNAIDAMPKGGTLTFELENRTVDQEFVASHRGLRSGSFVRLTVRDTGVGMTQEVRQNLFEPFFTTKDPVDAAGMGLSAVYGTIRQHQGAILVESEPGCGTAFHIYLPRSDDRDRPRPRPTPIDAIARSQETVLVVEDEPQVRRVMVRILEWLGYDILEAGNGEQALRVLDKTSKPIDLLITDVVMPRMGGIELAREFIKLRPETPVLFVSGYPRGTLTRDSELEPKAAFLKKPFDTMTFASKVREILDVGQTSG